ncbi:hypothetical protein, partial [Methylobacterium sp. CG08_land_8_20_14_0_20_71_15]
MDAAARRVREADLARLQALRARREAEAARALAARAQARAAAEAAERRAGAEAEARAEERLRGERAIYDGLSGGGAVGLAALVAVQDR